MFDRISITHASALVAALALGSSAASGAVIGTYTLDDSSLAASGVEQGITFSTLTVGPGASQDNLGVFPSGTSDALQIDGHGPYSSLNNSISNQSWLRFTITIANGYELDLDNIQVQISATNLYTTGGSNGRVYSSVEGYDQTTDDLLGSLGFSTSGNHAMTTQTIDLNSPPAASLNVSAADHDNLTGSVTFTIPWFDDSNSGTRYVDIHNIEVNGSVVAIPEPASLCLLGTLGLLMARRRRSRI